MITMGPDMMEFDRSYLFEFFRELAGIPVVSYFDHLGYSFILRRISELASAMPPETQVKMSIAVTQGQNLRISWSGSPRERRRLVLIAHVDREGFVVDGAEANLQGFSGFSVRGESVEPSRVSQGVRIHWNGKVLPAVLDSVDGASPRVHFISEGVPVESGLDLPSGVGLGEYELAPFSVDGSGVIASPCVDDAAGVAVALTTLVGAITADWPINLDLLLTRCEEPGFLGITREILSPSSELFSPDDTFIVVDSSNRSMGFALSAPWSIDSWSRRSLEHQKPTGVEFSSCVIRAGDRRLLYSSEVTRMAYLASLNARRKIALSITHSGKCKLAGELIFATFLKEEGLNVGPDYTVARMTGGWCEAGPLTLAGALRAASGLEDLRVKVGALALPVVNYRNFDEGRNERETCHSLALLRAVVLAGEIARMNQRYCFLANEYSAGNPDEVEKHIEDIQDWYKAERSSYFKICDRWLDSLAEENVELRRSASSGAKWRITGDQLPGLIIPRVAR